jgi:hypothetical protein
MAHAVCAVPFLPVLLLQRIHEATPTLLHHRTVAAINRQMGDGPTIKRKWLKYTWRVTTWLVTCFVVALLFGQTLTPQIQATMAVGGLLYTSIRVASLSQGLGIMTAFTGLAIDIEKIKARAFGEQPDPNTAAVASEHLLHNSAKIMIDFIFLGLIALISFFNLVSAI